MTGSSTKLLLLLLLGGLCSQGVARSYYSLLPSSPWAFRAWGSYKSVASIQQLRQTGVFPNNDVPVTEQRLRLGASLSKDWFRFEFANEVFLTAQTPNAATVALPDPYPSSFWNTNYTLYESDSVALKNRLDRAYVQLNFEQWQLTLGKQVIPMGVGHLFSAVSQTPKKPFVVVDAEYPVTEDALTLDWQGPLLIQARFLPKTPDQILHNFHFRLGERTNLYDLVLTVGRSDDKAFLGVEMARNLEGFVLRSEITGYEYEDRSTFQGLMGVDRVFSEDIDAKFELFYNGFGSGSPQDYSLTESPHRSAPYKGKLYAGAKAGYRINPLLKTSLASIVNLSDGSAILHFFMNYSILDNLELLVGQYLNISSHPQSEYGGKLPLAPGIETGLPDLTYLVLRLYF